MAVPLSKHYAKVSGLPFIERDEAAWLAIIAMLTAKAENADFDRVFSGFLTLKARERGVGSWADDGARSAARSSPLVVEANARYALAQSVKCEEKLGKELAALGYVLHQMLVHGVTKKTALQDSQIFGQKAVRYLRDLGYEDTAKVFHGRGAQTVASLWRKYESVLPYVYAWSLDCAARAGGHGQLHFEDLQAMHWIFLKQLRKNSRTKRIELKRLQIIVFE
jgi:hypothetical protein